jgi:probable O-glycosylation ligase (exosortase A-associated)
MIADNNDFGLALDMTAPIFFFLSTLESNKWLKRAFAALFLFTIPCVFFTYSRGALVGLMVIVTLMLLRLKQRVWLFPAIAVGVAVAVMFAPEAWKARMDPTSNEVIDASAMSRFNAWHFSWNLASDYPLTGGGFSTYTPRLFSEYALNALDVHGAHSIYFGVLGEHGFPGLALYLALVLSCFMTTSRLIRDARFFGDERVVLYANMFRFSILGFLTAGAFLGRSYFDYYFAVVACIVALNRAARQEWAAMEQASEEDELEEENDVLPVTGGQILEGV